MDLEGICCAILLQKCQKVVFGGVVIVDVLDCVDESFYINKVAGVVVLVTIWIVRFLAAVVLLVSSVGRGLGPQ